MVKPSVHCYDEFTQLEEVLLASVVGVNHTFDPTFTAFYRKQSLTGNVEYTKGLIQQHTNDLNGLKDILISLGVKVREQQTLSRVTQFTTPYWSAWTRPSDNPRDLILILGETIVETPPVVRDRLFENDAWKKVLYEYWDSGARWIKTPTPMLTIGSDNQKDIYDSPSPLPFLDREIRFDAAQIYKIGKDVVMNVYNHNSDLGFRWLKRTFPEYRWHTIYLGEEADHIDGEFAILRPGLLLVSHNIVEKPDLLPSFMKSWEKVEMADVAEYQNNLRLTSEGIYVNVLSINENTVLINEKAVKTIKKLEALKMTCIPVRFRHSTSFGGGIHCATLDVRRSGGMEDYIS